MISYRKQLQKIGYQSGTPVSYKGFYYQPTSFRKALKAMDAPKQHKFETEDPKRLDKSWTEEIQGVVWDGNNWIFSSNGSAPESPWGTQPKALYTFQGHTNFENPKHTFVIAEIYAKAGSFPDPKIPGPDGSADPFWVHHVGPMVFDPITDKLYVEHWNDKGGQLIVFINSEGQLFFHGWIKMESVIENNQAIRVGLVGIDFQNNIFYTCEGGENVSRIFLHKLNAAGDKAAFTNRTLQLTPGMVDGCPVQGGFFSPNGHLYITTGKGGIDRKVQYFYSYSALNGLQLSRTDVVAELNGPVPFKRQELEGICYAPVIRDDKSAQIHMVLLENISLAKDNIFLKSYSATEPDLI